MPRYKLTIGFSAPRLDAGLLAWAVRVFSDPDAPKDMTIRLEKVEPDG